MSLRVLITSPLEPDLVRRLTERHPDLEVVYPAELVPAPRFPAEHRYADFERLDPGQQAEWQQLLDSADILFDFGPRALWETLGSRPRLAWIQATSAGVGAMVRRIGLDRSPRPVVTSASGVHAGPLAEFALLGMLWFRKDVPRLQRLQREHNWERLAVGELRGAQVLVVGLGKIGTEVARDCRALGMRVVGFGRRPRDTTEELPVDDYRLIGALDEWLPRADFLVLCLPETEDSRGLLDARRLRLLPRDSVLINVGRGTTIDEEALIQALREGKLAGAALDVFATEPLPPESPLWDMPQVLVTPHSASTVALENERIVDIFEENIRLFLEGRPLINQLDKRAGY